ncbi:MAG: hypothetical protein ACTH8F_12480 [Microbacterium sp.]|uniref:hypothetical protein n=1 Tax=Microbacterium sp. TaxID=51671 RepID=UPI003F9CC4BC
MSNTTAYETDAREERPPSFVEGAWRNRRWTRSSSSILLGLIPTMLLVMSGGRLPVIGPALAEAGLLAQSTAPIVAGITATIALLNLLLFPFAREAYYRSTVALREGLGGIFVLGWMFLIVVVCRIAMFLVIWAIAIPAGILAMVTLGDEDRRGLGWRIS